MLKIPGDRSDSCSPAQHLCNAYGPSPKLTFSPLPRPGPSPRHGYVRHRAGGLRSEICIHSTDLLLVSGKTYVRFQTSSLYKQKPSNYKIKPKQPEYVLADRRRKNKIIDMHI